MSSLLCLGFIILISHSQSFLLCLAHHKHNPLPKNYDCIKWFYYSKLQIVQCKHRCCSDSTPSSSAQTNTGAVVQEDSSPRIGYLWKAEDRRSLVPPFVVDKKRFRILGDEATSLRLLACLIAEPKANGSNEIFYIFAVTPLISQDHCSSCHCHAKVGGWRGRIWRLSFVRGCVSSSSTTVEAVVGCRWRG